MQEFGDRYLLGDGTLTATAGTDSAEAARVHALTGMVDAGRDPSDDRAAAN